MFVALAVQFVYRYFAMTKSPKLKLFDSWRMPIWYTAMILISIFFGIIVFICGHLMELERNDGYRNSLYSTFELPLNSTIYYARMTYYTHDPLTNKILLDWCSLGCLFLLFLSITPVCVMFYCGIRTYRLMSKATSQLSNHMKLQKELFQALLIQSTVPCIFLFFPSLIYFIFPLFNLELGLFSNISGITFVIYPIIDPLAVIYVIKHYRCYVFKLFCLSHKITPKLQRDVCIDVAEDEARGNNNTNNNLEMFMSFNSISHE
ncbi:Protein CBG13756 [Caenorhabditis briggsae]|nr:Protein CBG13756 [Caenorhabditis briggsae]CAP32497.1 Protein CBG13756 [Caenorhabditis briggsae]